MQDFRKLRTWECAHRLALKVYRASDAFPSEELYGLTSQVRRASASIPANIAEGCGRGGGAELGRFLQIAMGSASELEYHLLLARDLGILETARHEELESDLLRLKRMLNTFIAKVRTAQK
ncbi:MAG: four helix bundle protein [Deferrisomatales bacterium]